MLQYNFNVRKMGWLIPLIIVLCIMPFFMGRYRVEVAILFFTYIILAQSYRLVNTTGDWSLCHYVLFGVGAYASGLFAKYAGMPVWVTIPMGGVMASVVALGIFNARLDGDLDRLEVSQEVRRELDEERIKMAGAMVPASAGPELRTALGRAIDESFVSAFRTVMVIAAVMAAAGGMSAALTIGKARAGQQ